MEMIYCTLGFSVSSSANEFSVRVLSLSREIIAHALILSSNLRQNITRVQ